MCMNVYVHLYLTEFVCMYVGLYACMFVRTRDGEKSVCVGEGGGGFVLHE